MYDTLEARFAASARRCTARGIRTSKLQLAFDALEFANGNVSEAKRIIAQRNLSISARTWAKAIGARILCSPTPVL
jgi:predicted transcriptional regulator